MSGLSNTGFSPLSLNDVKTQIENTLKSRLGPSINLVAPSLLATIIGIQAERESLIWALAEDVYNSQYPDTASGVALDNVVSFTGISRLPASSSKHPALLLFGTSGTVVPANTQVSVQGAPGSVFKTDLSVTLGAGVNAVQRIAFSALPALGSFVLGFRNETLPPLSFGATAQDLATALNGLLSLSQVTVTGSVASGFVVTFAGKNGAQPQTPIYMVSSLLSDVANNPVTISVRTTTSGAPQASVPVTATQTGPITAPARSLTVIGTPIAGLNSVSNQTDAVVGRAIESDLDLRIRRRKTLQIGGSSTRDAIRSKLLSKSGVTDVFIFENLTLVNDTAGRPAKSYEAVVNGGYDQEITQTIWDTKPAGIQTVGSISGTASDTQGASQVVKWSRPTVVPIYLELDITKDFNYPANGDALVQAAILEFGGALKIGQSIYVTPQLVSSLDEIPGIIGIAVKIGKTANPSVASSVIISTAQIAVFDSTRIVVSSS